MFKNQTISNKTLYFPVDYRSACISVKQAIFLQAVAAGGHVHVDLVDSGRVHPPHRKLRGPADLSQQADPVLL